MPRGEVPYARFEVTWLWHPKRRKYTATQREIFTSLWLLACHERRSSLCASCYPTVYLAQTININTRTLLRALRKLTEPDGLLRYEADGSLTIIGVEVKNARLDWKTGCPHSPNGTVVPPQKEEVSPIPLPVPIPVPIPLPPPYPPIERDSSFLSDFTETEKAIATQVFLQTLGGEPGNLDRWKSVYELARVAAQYIPVGQERERMELYRKFNSHVRTPIGFLQKFIDEQGRTPEEKVTQANQSDATTAVDAWAKKAFGGKADG